MPSVISSFPNVSLVINKLKQYNNTQLEANDIDDLSLAKERFSGEILGVYGGVEYKHIQSYVSRVEEAGTPIKIMVTYDSLSKCAYLLDKCHLIIDESDKLIAYMSMKVNGKKKEQPMDVVS